MLTELQRSQFVVAVLQGSQVLMVAMVTQAVFAHDAVMALSGYVFAVGFNMYQQHVEDRIVRLVTHAPSVDAPLAATLDKPEDNS